MARTSRGRRTASLSAVSAALLLLDSASLASAAPSPSSNTCRRWAHMSAQGTTANGSSVLYVYGGEASSSRTQRNDLWTNALYSFDLGANTSSLATGLQTLTAETAGAGSSNSASPPPVALGTLFALNASSNSDSPLVVYGGSWSDTPSITPSSVGITTLQPSISTQPLPSGIYAAAEGAHAWDPLTQRGWVHGGQLDTHTQPGWSEQVARIYLDSLLQFDYSAGVASPKVTNMTSDRGPMADHTMTFLPASATNTSEGVLVIIGGMLASGGNSLVDMSSVYMYDIGADQWSTESTKTASGGGMPQSRVNHCAVMAVGEVNGMQRWQVYIHGGQNLDQSQQYSDTWVLSGPDLTWVQVTDDSSSNAPSGRAGHTCNLDGSQLLVIGGFAASYACDSPGFYVLDVPSASWVSSFTTGTTYQTPTMLNAVIGGTAIGGSSQSGLGGFTGSGVAASPNAPSGGSSGTIGGSGSGSQGGSSGGGSPGDGGTSSGGGNPSTGGTATGGGTGEGRTGGNTTSSGGEGSSTPAGLIAGVVVGALALIAIAAYGFRRYRKVRRGEGPLPAWVGRGHYRFASDASSVNSSIYQRYDPDAAAVSGNPYGHVQTTEGNTDSAKFGTAGAAERAALMTEARSGDVHDGPSRRPIATAAGFEHSSGDSTPRPSTEADVADPMRMYGGGPDSREPSTPSSGISATNGATLAAMPPFMRTTSDFDHGAWIHQTGSTSRLVPAPMLRVTNASNSSHSSHDGHSSADFYTPPGQTDWERFNRRDANSPVDPRVLRVANPGTSQFSLSNRTYNSTAATTSHEGETASTAHAHPPVALPSGARYVAPSVSSRAGHSSTSGSRRSNATSSTGRPRTESPFRDDESEDYMWRR